MRKIGDILLDLEVILDEMCDQGLQWGDILALIHQQLTTHRQDAQEEFVEGGHPIYYYGPEK